MLEWLQIDLWSPYIVGAGIGILSWFSFLLSNQPVSCSGAFSQTGGMLERLFGGKKILDKEYYKQFPPIVNWRWMFLVGVLIGAFVSSLLSGSFDLRWVPVLWEQTFGAGAVPRLITAFIGGILMGFGARWSNGCTSGHGISGTLQLAVSSWISAAMFFIGGITAAMFIYHVI